MLSKQILKNSIKGLNVCMLAGIGTLLVTVGIMHNNLYASTTIPTNYDISEITSTLYRSVPAGYIKPSYKFEVDPDRNTPSINELSADEAAEIIAQEMYRYFKTDISGKTLRLSYFEGFIGSNNEVIKSDPKKIQDIQEVIATSGFIPETIKSVTFNICRISPVLRENKTGIIVYAVFKLVTVSDKSYTVTLPEDLTRVRSILMPHD